MSPKNLFEAQAIVKVIGVGGGGCNAVNRMVAAGVQGVQFIAMNTDRQALEHSLADEKIALGESQTRGLGTGGDPAKGLSSAKESERAITEILEGADMVFVTAGMGGGTGTGAAPYVAELSKRLDILTVGVVTRPFEFEGPKRKRNAQSGLDLLAEKTDTLIVIPNDNMMKVVERKTTLQDAFSAADDVLRQGVQGISDIVLNTGVVNVDFADVRAVMKDAGIALMGIGRGVGENRARVAAEMAANSELLEFSISGAKRLLVNFTAGPDFAIGEAYDAMDYLLQLAHAEDAAVFMGHVVDENMHDEVQLTLLAADLDKVSNAISKSDVFSQTAVRSTRNPAETPQIGIGRESPKEIEIDELDLDIPTFLRKQRQGFTA
ncbi:MAG: cell division protein FtsZ [Chthonomonadaceae bacterium]|nr:cell division protein FtsZ [Chthonomonadaceae bacterium]